MATVQTETATRAAAQVAHDRMMAVYVTAIDYRNMRAFSFSFGTEPATYDYATAVALTGEGAARPYYNLCLHIVQEYLAGRADYSAMRDIVREKITQLIGCGNSQQASGEYLETLWRPVELAHKADTGYIN